MKVNKDYILKNVLNSYILINIKKNDNQVIKLNETSKDIFELINNGLSKEQIMPILNDKYDESLDNISRDFDNFVSEMKKTGIFIDEKDL